MRLLLAPVELLAFGELLAEPLLDRFGNGDVMVILAQDALAIRVRLLWASSDKINVTLRVSYDSIRVLTDAHYDEPYAELDISDPACVDKAITAVEEITQLGSRDAAFAHRDRLRQRRICRG